MKTQMLKLKKWLKSEKGQNMTEYILMLGLIAAVVVILGKMFKPQISALFNQIMGSISGAANSVTSTN